VIVHICIVGTGGTVWDGQRFQEWDRLGIPSWAVTFPAELSSRGWYQSPQEAERFDQEIARTRQVDPSCSPGTAWR
jgi:hypothetical protein